MFGYTAVDDNSANITVMDYNVKLQFNFNLITSLSCNVNSEVRL